MDRLTFSSTTEMYPIVTVIIPTFRRPHLLKKAIQSVLDQSYPHFLIQIYDNASGDKTAEVVAELARQDQRIHYHVHETNIGSNGNWQYGFSHVTTPFFAFLSDDDLLMPNFLEEAVKGFTKHPAAGIFIAGLIITDEKNRIIAFDLNQWSKSEFLTPQEMIALVLKQSFLPFWSSMVFRREVRDAAVQLRTDLVWHDVEFLARSFKQFPVVLSEVPGSIFLIHTSNISQSLTVLEYQRMRLYLNRMPEGLFTEAQQDNLNQVSLQNSASLLLRFSLHKLGKGNFEEAFEGFKTLHSEDLLNISGSFLHFVLKRGQKHKRFLLSLSTMIYKMRRTLLAIVYRYRLKRKISDIQYRNFKALTQNESRAKNRTKRIQMSALTGLASSGAVAAFTLFSAPITINYLGKELYGIWVLITSFFIWAQLFDFGILNGLTNALTEAFSRDDYDSARSYICTTFFATLIIAALGSVLWTAAAVLIPWTTFITVNSEAQGNVLMYGILLVGVFFLLSLPFSLFSRILHAYQRMYVSHIANFITYLLSLTALILGVYNKFSLLQLLFVVSVIPLGWYIFCWYMLSKKFTWTRFSLKLVTKESFNRILSSSIPILVWQLITVITTQMTPILLSSVTTLKEIADYNILWKIYLFVFLMMTNLSSSFSPALRDAVGRGEIDWAKKNLKRLLIFHACMIVIGCLPLLLIGNKLIATWIRMPLEHPLTNFDWMIYVLCILFSVVSTTLTNILIIFDKVAMQIYLSLFSNFCLCSLILIGVPRWGLIAIFGCMGVTALFSIYHSLKAITKLLNRKELKI